MFGHEDSRTRGQPSTSIWDTWRTRSSPSRPTTRRRTTGLRAVPSGKHLVPFRDAPDEHAYWFQGSFGSGEDRVPARMLDGFRPGAYFAEAGPAQGVITSDEGFSPPGTIRGR
ncbi:MAG TPA: hypothetical protein VHC67_09395 [Gaiellaceae bacterium]|nr:hypothetical protein [Gaiellaceae bacterium]